MVVDEFYIFRTSFSPDEAETPLRVHSNAVLTTAVTYQPLEAVPGRDPEVLDILRRMDELKLSQNPRISAE